MILRPNAQCDMLNILGSERFDKDTGQELTQFYSIDMFKPSRGSQKMNSHKKMGIDPVRHRNRLTPSLQKKLWEIPPEATDHTPGKLSLCHGLPMMVKYNIATECCVTKGAEGVVVGWSAFPIDRYHQGLDVVFVKLINPPCTVQLHGLPKNVVPIHSVKQDVFCQLPNDEIITIERMQVQLLPNFAMTDYSSQRRTRPNNVVNPSGCATHHSYYTALSHSASAEGTILLSPIDPTKVTGGIS